ncbi:HAD-IC family P-type ATPase [Companilactobacillus sp.]|jgi:cation-transporting ATPase E|uniref:HAD-IC family P-type ATPase n=2 Tax=Companilactobacillus sp. TaxID=2767905 RepID=UPI0025BCF3A5|nr:HAD-IC family P-type ATPase [Companilactobacillus sp.]MCH4009000.1 HAD-IC family P-type ATPase [Companilactobacillus sp.]MCH4050821.1 HAD-IC family P-type ATPase [Companilactobacillus sp.]MCH4125518.1 HAD-IC family P-type ATPase [Companilactobacillus sp.]MCI1311227.1 HAD-IC family P-type ATPase [Companilactobacillus sp.]MCI1342749.1 HAD-IC family P-type ATPase [Companilactobacillus sp.]
MKVKQPEVYTNINSGLTNQEVTKKIAAGLTNVQIKKLSRSIPQILADNIFTLFNFLNLVIALLIGWTGSYRNLFFLGPVLANIIIGSFQQIRAKLTVDKINLVNEQEFTVIRDNKEVQVPIEDLVQDDIVILKRGNTIPADGIIRSSNGLQTNESSITGEADTIEKFENDSVYSGSFAIAGQAKIQLTQVGMNSFVSKLSNAVSQEKGSESILMKIINNIIKILTYTIVPIGLILFFRSFLKNGDVAQSILGTSASVIGMIPEGLVLLTAVALATGAYNLSKKKILVRSLNAIETLARVDTLCLDKTGTITTGKLTVKKIHPEASFDEKFVKQVAATIVEVTQETNATAQAIKKLKSETFKEKVSEVLPFSSETKYSGYIGESGTKYMMGAPEFIIDNPTAETKDAVEKAAEKGFRVIAVLRCVNDKQELLGLIFISDEVRKQAKSTFSYLKNQGIDLKIISGDNPVTVSNVASQAGIDKTDNYIDMSTVPEDADYTKLVDKYRVFGRVRPKEKSDLIAAMQKNGLTVGMTGDGVNDVLAMRQSDCSIAIAGESDAAESSADFVLLNRNFDSMIFMLNEGRRVINNVERVASLYLIKTIYSVVLSIVFIFLGSGYPFQPSQLTPVNALTVGIPTFILALEPNYRPPAGRFMRNVMEIALPAAICNIILILSINGIGSWANLSFKSTSTMSVFAIGIIGYCALISISNPLIIRKKIMIAASMLLFVIAFTYSDKLFGLQSIFDLRFTFIYISILLLAWPLFMFMREVLGRRVFSKINWK